MSEKAVYQGIKELVDPAQLIDIAKNASYSKPRWMMNDSIYDHVWLTSKTGLDISYFRKHKDKAMKVNFDRMVSDNESLTAPINKPLLRDIQHSLLYLDARGKITRPLRVRDILVSVVKLIKHANEIRQANSMPLVRSLEQIRFEELKDFLLAFNVSPEIFHDALDITESRYGGLALVDWIELKGELGLNSRELESLKHALRRYYKSKEGADEGGRESLDSQWHVNDTEEELFDLRKWNNSRPLREYPAVNELDFDIDVDLYPSEKTISNVISQLEAIYTARTAQKYKFLYSPSTLFVNGKALFDEMRDSAKTPLIPVDTYLYSISEALRFVRNYGSALRQYIAQLSRSEVDEIKVRVGCSRSSRKLQEEVFEKTPVPDALKSLNITSWCDDGDLSSFSQFRNEISVAVTIRLYVAAMWILIASFVASRITSMKNLKRNCFVQSPIDGLFDLVLRIPKSSERVELEDVHRPIPDLIFDYGLEFALLNNEIEERRGICINENDQFLFGGFLSHRSFNANCADSLKAQIRPLGGDYINICLDLFSDWSDSPLIGGKRWYPRSHQYRRTFAVIYFNFSDHVGLEELSWFMGHSSLDQTFHYAEVAPSSEWIEEAEASIARIGASLSKVIHGDNDVKRIVNKAREKASVSLVLEPLVRTLIEDHKKKTGEHVRFRRIGDNNIFFYFSK
ncbi:Integrase [Vibrio crassostreae]|nr:Integrase [Vibrio crassostreae]